MTCFLVTGVSGLLGLNFSLQLSTDHTVIGIYNQHDIHTSPFKVISTDLVKTNVLEALLDQTQPDIVVNCAALTNIDQCETDSELAHKINCELPGRLASVTRRLGIRLVHVSTDAVFDGRKGEYSEEDSPNPINIYSKTKLDGERRVVERNPDALIFRVNFYGWSLKGKRSLAEWFYNNLIEGNCVKGFIDVNFCPLLVNHLVGAMTRMIELEMSGLYHAVSSESLSKYEFGVRLANKFGFDEDLITASTLRDGGLKAARSLNLTLRTQKIAGVLGEPLPNQKMGLEGFYKLHQEGFPQRVRVMGVSKADQEKDSMEVRNGN